MNIVEDSQIYSHSVDGKKADEVIIPDEA